VLLRIQHWPFDTAALGYWVGGDDSRASGEAAYQEVGAVRGSRAVRHSS